RHTRPRFKLFVVALSRHVSLDRKSGTATLSGRTLTPKIARRRLAVDPVHPLCIGLRPSIHVRPPLRFSHRVAGTLDGMTAVDSFVVFSVDFATQLHDNFLPHTRAI